MEKNANRPKVLVFGTFDGIHKGHIYFLKEAAKLGNLYVSIATDLATKKLKSHFPKYSEKEREAAVEKLGIANQVLIGDDEIESWKTLKALTPNIVALGYDQKRLKEVLKPLSKEFGFNIKVLKGFEPKKYHSKFLTT
ncbi:MAG TPA: adenylyltransferase/cytidyltransferase family protein [Candidatus Paceibacterota bacterium]|nr:adenylyltransferase/cytidyltransferase family protein [Candidatus Paceibacterota bacterium]